MELHNKRCEESISSTTKCKCSCGGKYHGRARLTNSIKGKVSSNFIIPCYAKYRIKKIEQWLSSVIDETKDILQQSARTESEKQFCFGRIDAFREVQLQLKKNGGNNGLIAMELHSKRCEESNTRCELVKTTSPTCKMFINHLYALDKETAIRKTQSQFPNLSIGNAYPDEDWKIEYRWCVEVLARRKE